ncbi:glucose-fructose oxidoreductase domain-containing protein 2 [Caerostris extrusa]|uniref:Glucose-fructose oxidoreductase domain-containing protein 2 n=1 Tax=Caerostris extrusa TaxID=172846 RepID=A0AAV4WSQ6_CAEEX|nr:glucose-fructose oxidoreductase domain-containing protein 2 [Caerostris extrusa]
MQKVVRDGYIKICLSVMQVQCEVYHDRYDWTCDELMGGGLLTNVGSHIIDIITYTTGRRACVSMVCEGHVVVRGGDLYGQKTTALKEEVLYLDIEDLKQSSVISHSSSPSSVDMTQNNVNALLPKPYMKGLLKMIGALKDAFATQEDLQSWVKEPVAMAATFEDGQYIQTVIDAIRLSSKAREWVKVELLTEDPDTQQHLSSMP